MTTTDDDSTDIESAIVLTSGTRPTLMDTLWKRDARVSYFLAAEIAPSTRRAYEGAWRRYTEWCAAHDMTPLPSHPGTLAVYLSEQAAAGINPRTLRVAMSAIKLVHERTDHESPTEHPNIRRLIKGIKRECGRPAKQKEGLTLEDVRKMVQGCDASTAKGVRDRALLLMWFLGGFRRSEVSGLDLESLTHRVGGIVVLLSRSKTDQEGTGREVPIPSGPATEAIDAWVACLASHGITTGPLFHAIDKWGSIQGRLGGHGLACLVKQLVAEVGLDPSLYAGHSLRAGLVTEAARRGARIEHITKRTGHHGVKQVQEYIRRGTLFEVDPITRMGDELLPDVNEEVSP